MEQAMKEGGFDSMILDMIADKLVDKLQDRLEKIVQSLVKQQQDNDVPQGWIDRAELLRQLNIDNSTMFKWEKEGKLVRFGQIGGKIYYLRSDVEQAMKKRNKH